MADTIFGCIPRVDATQLHAVLDMCAAGKRVAMIYGPPGVGKSTIVAAWAADHGYSLFDIRLAQLLPEHMAAIQYPDANREHVLRLTPAIVAAVRKLRADSGKPVLIFADELTLASQETLSAALEMILDRKINGFDFPADTHIVAAGNRPQDTSSACTLDPPVRSRLVSVVYVPSQHDVALYLTTSRPKCPLTTLAAGWLLSQQATSLMDSENITEAAAFYTPRGFESAIALAAAHFKAGDAKAPASNPMVALAFQASVGSAVMSNFNSWAGMQGVIKKPADVLSNDLATPPQTQEALSAQLDAIREHLKALEWDEKLMLRWITYMMDATQEQLQVWLEKQSTVVLNAIGGVSRGQRLLETLDIKAVPSTRAKAKR